MEQNIKLILLLVSILLLASVAVDKPGRFGLLVAVSDCAPYSPADAETLQTDLLSNYSKKNRPDNTTQVDIYLGLMHITALDIVSQRLHVVGFLIAMWNDSRLAWTPSAYGDMEQMFILLSDIWAPPLVLNNAADEIAIINDNSDLASVYVFLSQGGSVGWMAPANFVAQCSVDIQYYPFDSQICNIVVSSWLFLEEHLDIYSTSPNINLDIYKENGEWDIVTTSVTNISRILLGYEMPAIQYSITLQRKYSYYVMNMLLPVIILAIMAPFVFVLPIESGEKIGYALTILLSLSVVMTLVSDNIPPTSTHVCTLSVYLLMTFMICSLITLVTVVECRFHAFHSRGHKLSPRMQRTAVFLAKLTCSRHANDKENDLRDDTDNKSENRNSMALKSTNKVADTNYNEKKFPPTREKEKAWNGRRQEAGSCASDDKHKTDYTWEDFANMLDKLNFFVSAILTCVVTLIFMIMLPVGGKSG